MDEARRQRDLLHALGGTGIDGLREQGARAARGLAAYRANAEATADRALAAAFATVRAMVGPEDFRRLARAFWEAHPPQRGDLGEWGDAFPPWLQAHADLAAWPYLGDCARLDLALHRNERAADAALDAGSLTLLESTDPARLHLRLMPGTTLLRSAWPVVSIHRAHQLDPAAADPAFAAVRAAIAAQVGEDALVVREGWRAVVHPLAGAEARWTEGLLSGANLDDALRSAGASFDFAAWLQNALRRQWLNAVVAVHDGPQALHGTPS
jgi:hypothetical protein